MVGALEALGVQVEIDWAAGCAIVHGCAGRFPAQGAELFLGNAGTAMRWVSSILLRVLTFTVRVVMATGWHQAGLSTSNDMRALLREKLEAGMR